MQELMVHAQETREGFRGKRVKNRDNVWELTKMKRTWRYDANFSED